MNKGLVSIIIPCYNAEKYLEDCLNSLISQTYNNMEVIIVDDGSTDNSNKIIDNYIVKFLACNKKIIKLEQENSGQAAAVNNALKYAQGEFLMWQDADDFYENDAVEVMVNYLYGDLDKDFARGKVAFRKDNQNKDIIRIGESKFPKLTNIFDNYIFEKDTYSYAGIFIIRMEYFDKCVKNREIFKSRAGQNWQIILPVAYKGKCGYIDKVVYNCRIVENSHSRFYMSIKDKIKREDKLKDILYNVLNNIEEMGKQQLMHYKLKLRLKYVKRKTIIVTKGILSKIKRFLINCNIISDKNRSNKQEEHTNNCCGCHACYNICSKKAIEMKEDKNGFKYPTVNKEKCINCGLCKKVCPIINNKKIENKPKAFACINKNKDIRMQSSSGGIFTLLAENIIEKYGVVFGATFDENFSVKHCMLKNKEELYKFRGSKYVQSSIGDTYKIAKEYLDRDRYVLFTGTPCQIEGLKTYLQKDYEKLYTQDIICHGVPSTKVWKEYIKNIDNTIRKVSFRNKENGWKGYYTYIEGEKRRYNVEHSKDLFMQAFLKNICLRESCYNCFFKKKNRNSDITLADFWGIQNIKPEFDDDKGTSLVIINSNKGKNLFNNIKDNIKFEEVNLDEAIKYNPCMIKSVAMPKERERFFKDLDNKLDNKNILDTIRNNLPREKTITNVKKKIKRGIKKVIEIKK